MPMSHPEASAAQTHQQHVLPRGGQEGTRGVRMEAPSDRVQTVLTYEVLRGLPHLLYALESPNQSPYLPVRKL